MKDVSVSSIMIDYPPLKNCLIKTILFQFTIETYNVWPQKYLKYIWEKRLRFCKKFFLYLNHWHTVYDFNLNSAQDQQKPFILGPKIWEIVPSELKPCERVDVFKSKIRKWQPHKCPCRLCDTYIHQIGFI